MDYSQRARKNYVLFRIIATIIEIRIAINPIGLSSSTKSGGVLMKVTVNFSFSVARAP